MRRDTPAPTRTQRNAKGKTSSSTANVSPQASVVTAKRALRGEDLGPAAHKAVDRARETTSDRPVPSRTKARARTPSKPRSIGARAARQKTRSSATKVAHAERPLHRRPSTRSGGPVASTLESVGALSQLAA